MRKKKKKMNEIELKEKSFIEILNDKYIVSDKLCQDTIEYLEKTIENKRPV